MSSSLCCVPCAASASAAWPNPILGPDHPDPSVLKVGPDYYLSFTPGDRNIGLFHSTDLVNWAANGKGLFNNASSSAPGSSVQLLRNESWHYCDIWSPLIVDLHTHTHPSHSSSYRFQLIFSARRFPTAQNPCPRLPFPYSGTLYQAFSQTVAGPYINIDILSPAQSCSHSAPHSLERAGKDWAYDTSSRCYLVIRHLLI